ncbi:ABC-type multidrug transport system, outer membrane protein [Candidatus Gastranaerophilus sp. (ex Termes propinquus)]|nr:ABC-type multidrug transport system, outer membrane protein [Candidatus Gastranaerophilus sp. (ex Termes propinquus)]
MKTSKAPFFAILALMLIMLQAPVYCKLKKAPRVSDKVLSPEQKLEYINFPFWQRFCDPYLEKYILMATENNHSARAASWRVEQYRQEVKKTLGVEFPQLSVAANYVGVHLPFDGFNSLPSNGIAVPFIATWELDLLGKNWDRVKSAKEQYAAQIYDEKAAYLALASDVGTVYLNILQYDYLIELQKDYLAFQDAIVKRSDSRFVTGTIDALVLNADVRSFQDAKNALEEYEKQRKILLTQLALLTGEVPNTELERGTLRDFDYRYQIPCEVPSDIIFSRPDVLSAEARMKSAGLDISAARKDLFPRFNVTGFLIFSSFFPGNFFSWDSILALLLAGATQDIFRGGQKIAQLRQSKSVYEQMLEEYNNIDLTALKEVNDALYMVKKDDIIDTNTLAKLHLQADDFRRAKNKLQRGTISVPDIYLEEQRLLSLKQEQAQSKAARIVNYFTLYKAVGGAL